MTTGSSEPRWRTLLALALRLVLGGLFAVAGALKLRDPSRFALEIANYQLRPEWAPYLAVALPGIEIAVAGVLIFGSRRWRRGAALAAVAMLVAFTYAVASALARGVNIECGCFGGGEGPISSLTVVRNVGLLAAALALAALELVGPEAPAPVPRGA